MREGFDAVDPGQLHVHQHERRVERPRELDRILARGRLERAVPLGLQHVADELHVRLVVLDDKDPLTRHCGLPSRSEA